MQYKYVAYSLAAGVVKGKIEADDEAEVREHLDLEGYKPLRIKRPSQFSLDEFLSSLDQVKPKELFGFARQASTMLDSGATLLRSLEMLQVEGTSKAMKKVLVQIHDRVSQGEGFTVALREHPKVFDEVFVSLVEVGEHTGKLGPALNELADIMHQQQEATAKTKKAMMMPMFLIGTSMLMLGFMAFVAFPPLIKTFNEMNVEVPLVTSLLIGSITGLKENIVNVVAIVVGVIVSYKMLGRFPTTKYWMDQVKARMPILGPIMLAGELGRFTRIMSTLLGSGVDLPSALRLAMSSTKNEAIKRAWEDADQSLIDGHRMEEALTEHSVLPRMLVELLAIGEEGNTLPQVTEELANSYEKQFDDRVEGLLGILEPISTFTVGGLVLFMALSVLKPILSAAQEIE